MTAGAAAGGIAGDAGPPICWTMLRTRRRPGLPFLIVALALGLGVPDARADCTEGAGPKVNWHRCLQDDRVLTKVDLTDAMLREASFLRTDLSGSSLKNADAYRAKFVSATLVDVVFDGARLIDSDFSRADLTGASFKGADLRNARLFNANLKRANLTGAKLDRADLRNAELAGATWTDGARVCSDASIGQCN